MWQRDLKRASAQGFEVDVEVYGLTPGFWGYPLARAGALVAFWAMHETCFRGVVLVSARSLRSVGRNDYVRALSRITRNTGRLPNVLPRVDLGDGTWRGAFEGERIGGRIIQVHTTLHPPDESVLGVVEAFDDTGLDLRTFDERGRHVGGGPTRLAWQEVIAVTLQSDYLRVYERLLASGRALLPADLAPSEGLCDIDVSADDPAALRRALEQAGATTQCVRMGGPSLWFQVRRVLRVSDEWVLAVGLHDLSWDNVEALRLREVRTARSGFSEHCKTVLLRREGRTAEVGRGVVDVDLGSVASLLAADVPLLIVRRERRRPFRGRILEHQSRSSKGQRLTLGGEWAGVDTLTHRSVTRVTLASDLLRSLCQYALLG